MTATPTLPVINVDPLWVQDFYVATTFIPDVVVYMTADDMAENKMWIIGQWVGGGPMALPYHIIPTLMEYLSPYPGILMHPDPTAMLRMLEV